MKQTLLFDEPLQVQIAKNRDGRTLDDYAFLYTGTSTGRHSNIHFMMSLEDAMEWCSSELSHGAIYGAEWAYFWTRVSTFISCQWGDNVINLKGFTDNGQWDDKIASLGLLKISIAEIPEVLGPLGVIIKK